MPKPKPDNLLCKCGANAWEYFGKEVRETATIFSVVCLYCNAEYSITFIHTQPNEVIGK
jgi:hypothetical protein